MPLIVNDIFVNNELSANTLVSNSILLSGNNITELFLPSINNVKVINQLSDFPPSVSNSITLLNNTLYLIANNINLVNNRLIITGNTVINGSSSSIDSFSYSGSNTLFTITNNFSMSDLTITSPNAANIFNTTLQSANILTLQDNIFNSSKNIGNISGGNIISILNNGFYNVTGNGFSFSSITQLEYADNEHIFGFSGVNINILNGTYEIIRIKDNYINLPLSGVGINIYSGITFTTVNGGGIIISNILTSNPTTTTPLSGIQYYDVNWEINTNLNIESSQPSGEMNLTSNIIETPLIVNIWTKISGITSSGTLQQFTMPENNKLKYIGKRVKQAKIVLVYSISSIVNNQTLQISFYQNGIQLSPPISETRTINSGESVNGSLVDLITIHENDYFELYIRNITGSNNAIIEFMNFTISS